MNIDTARLCLRIFKPDDLDELSRIFGKAENMKYLGLNGEPMTKAETEAVLLSMIGHWARHNFGRWAVISKENGKLIGCSGLRSHENGAELVYLIDESEWGKGLATEIALASLKFGFRQHKFKKIVAFARHANSASRRVMEKVGMQYKKELTMYEIFVVQYEITREEFMAQAAGKKQTAVNKETINFLKYESA